jgi:uncharacterized membrane protein
MWNHFWAGDKLKKAEYLAALKSELAVFNEVEANEVIRDQEEYIVEAIKSGRDEESVVKALGSPKDLAQELKASYQINKATHEEKILPKFKSVLKAILALCVLAPFNLIFVVGPFFGAIGVLVAIWAVALTISALGLGGVPFSLLGIANVALFSTIMFSSLALFCFGILCLVGSFVLTKYFLTFTASYLKWNYQFITGEQR